MVKGGETMNVLLKLLPIALIFMLAACSEEVVVEENANLQLEENDIQVTLPPQFFEGMDEEAIQQEAKDQDIKRAEVNSDGSVTYTMTKERHQEIVNSFKEELDFAITDIAESEGYPSIMKIEADDQYEEFNIYVNRSQFEKGTDIMATISLYIASSYYHAFLGNGDSFKATLNYIDESNDEVFKTMVLPEQLEESVE